VRDDFNYIRVTARDKAILRTISDVLLEDLERAPPSNAPAPEDVEISDADAVRLLGLLQELVKDADFVRRANFAEAVAKDNSVGNWKLAKLYFANSRSLRLRSTGENVERAWEEFVKAYAHISYHEFLARESELLAQLEIHPSIISLLVNTAFRFERLFDNAELRSRLSRKGTIVRAINKTSKSLEERLARPMFRGWISKTRLTAAAMITADATALFAGAQLSAVSLISTFGGASANLFISDDIGRQRR